MCMTTDDATDRVRRHRKACAYKIRTALQEAVSANLEIAAEVEDLNGES
jgi:hypothetical protein